MNIIGKFYKPFDNSFCIDHKGKRAYLLAWSGSNKHNPTKHEINARLQIISNPYKETVATMSGLLKEYTFIKVKSNITGEIYRVLYFKDGVINSYKEYINDRGVAKSG